MVAGVFLTLQCPIKDRFGGGRDKCHHNGSRKGTDSRVYESGVKPPEHQKCKGFVSDLVDHRVSQWRKEPCEHAHEQGDTHPHGEQRTPPTMTVCHIHGESRSHPGKTRAKIAGTIIKGAMTKTMTPRKTAPAPSIPTRSSNFLSPAISNLTLRKARSNLQPQQQHRMGFLPWLRRR